jgi:hypothetical protein
MDCASLPRSSAKGVVKLKNNGDGDVERQCHGLKGGGKKSDSGVIRTHAGNPKCFRGIRLNRSATLP